MALWLWATVAAILLAAFFWWKVPAYLVNYYYLCKTLKPIPGWPPHWFWGHLRMLRPDEDTLRKVTAWYQEHRHKLNAVWLGPIHPIVSLNHYEAIKAAIKEPKHHDTYRFLNPWLGDGLLISEGPKWHRNRHLLTPAFHFEILKPYVSVYNSCVEVLLNRWSDTARRNEPVKLFETLSLMSLDIITQCAFSYKSDCQNVKKRHPYIKAVYELIDHMAIRFFNPLYHIDWLYALTPAGRKMKEACRIVHEHSERVIQERKKALRVDGGSAGGEGAAIWEGGANQKKYLDFLDILLTATDEEGKGLTDLEIRNEVDTFMFEGHDTTTSGVSWTLYCLAKYPEHQEKVREEVRSVLMGREWLEYNDLKELKYTQWCIKEAMRLYPPVFIIFREASKELQLCGYTVPKGVHLFIPIYLLHHNPDIWPNPEEFDPLRFHPSNAEVRDPFAYMPFSADSRNCIGQNFAMNEERVVVASIVHRFALSLDESHRVEIVPKVVLRTKDDIKLNLKPLL